jgi:hypothetical protein
MIAAEMPELSENSPELLSAHYYLQNIRIALGGGEHFLPKWSSCGDALLSLRPRPASPCGAGKFQPDVLPVAVRIGT